ncbi:MAG: tRNA pseudouridine(55) synthase TruB [Rickettsiales bacterium]|jgi:tRNA pseudouridine55 synthase|nr:tRNA pseudouridine(55) synthase TruB [Rickettsiales bacterium]
MTERITASGWLNLNKPRGHGSSRVVAVVKKITGAKKVGHGGTLDPLASGVLPISINNATKQTEFLMNYSKTYLFDITFGEFKDTYDAEGATVEKNGLVPSENDIDSILNNFIGSVDQEPPAYSAIKINGRRACDLARSGVTVELATRKVIINDLKFIGFINYDTARFVVDCSRGCYVRSLAVAMARILGVLGYVSKLVRLRVGNLYISNSLEVSELTLAEITRNLIVY